MDGAKDRQKLAAAAVIGLALLACIAIAALLAGSYVYLGSQPQPGPSPSPEPTPIAIDTSTPVPIQASNPFHIETMKCDQARRTYTFTLTLEPGAHPAEISKIVVNATHAGKDYGTVWSPGHSGMMAWTKKTYDDGALHYGDMLTIIIDVAASDIPMDEKRTQITFFYDGNAAFTQDMSPV